MKDPMKLSREEKDILTEALRKTKNLPPMQGRITLHISPELKVSAAEFNFVKK
jgi:hypothetical protein